MSPFIPSIKSEAIRVERERGGEGWLVILPNGHGWLHGDLAAALADARELAADYGLTVISTADTPL